MGFSFFSGVPCSFLKNLINYAINECTYIIPQMKEMLLPVVPAPLLVVPDRLY
jgi:hypothetical protein